MSAVSAIGESQELEGFALVGVSIQVATNPDDVISAWQRLDDDVGLVILSATAAETLAPLFGDRQETLTVVMP